MRVMLPRIPQAGVAAWCEREAHRRRRHQRRADPEGGGVTDRVPQQAGHRARRQGGKSEDERVAADGGRADLRRHEVHHVARGEPSVSA